MLAANCEVARVAALGRALATYRWEVPRHGETPRASGVDGFQKALEAALPAAVCFEARACRPRPSLECVGLIDTAGGCPHKHVVALPKLASLSFVEAAQASESLKCLHLDHEIEVQQICDLWKQLTPPRPAAWDENIKPSRLCELIFGVEAGSGAETGGRSNVQFRCACWGSSFGMCHGTSTRHYGHVLRLDDLRKSVG